MSKLLTISIAAYNVESYLKQTLDSCIVPDELQDYLEILIINDGSTDNTLKMAMEYVNEYPDLFICINKKNGGYGSTINAALEIARGKYFRLLDGDDWVDTNELVKFITNLLNEKEDVDLILNDFSIVHHKGKSTEHRSLNLNDNEVKKISEMPVFDNLAMYSFCYKTEMLKSYRIKINENCYYTDLEFVALPLRYVKNYKYISNNLYQYRIGLEGQSVSVNGMRRHYKDAQKVLNILLDELNRGYDSENIKNIIEQMVCMMVKRFIRCMMCIEISNTNRKKILEFDNEIKKRFPEIYLAIDKSLTFYILRKTHYWLYPVWYLIKVLN